MYVFRNTNTGEVWEDIMSYQNMKELTSDPEIEQVFTPLKIISGISGITHKNDSGFRDVLSRIAEANPHSPLAKEYGNKGIKETKTRDAVDKAKLKS